MNKYIENISLDYLCIFGYYYYDYEFSGIRIYG